MNFLLRLLQLLIILSYHFLTNKILHLSASDWCFYFVYISATVSNQNNIRGSFEKFVDSPYYSKSELCGGVVTVSFSKYLPWQAMHFLQCSTHFLKNVLETVDHFEISCLRAPVSWLKKPRNCMGHDLDCMAGIIMGFH
jgi:hypothetical protein